MAGSIKEMIFGKHWTKKVDKKALSDICNANDIKIEKNWELAKKTEGDCYNFVNSETNEVLFVATKREYMFTKNMIEMLKRDEKDQITFRIANVIVDPNVKSVYYEVGDNQKNLFMCRNDGIDIVTLILTKEQMIHIAEHFSENKVF